MKNHVLPFPALLSMLTNSFTADLIEHRLNLLLDGARLTGYAYDDILHCGFFAALAEGSDTPTFLSFYTTEGELVLEPITDLKGPLDPEPIPAAPLGGTSGH